MSLRRSLRLVLLLTVALAGGACSSFDRDWKAAAARPAVRGDAFGGAWDGQWTSEKHRLPSGPAGGRLRCIFTRQNAETYRARFRANWLVFASGYEVDFRTRQAGRTLQFEGEHDLGAIFGGVYRYRGVVTPGRFTASFRASSDYGQFHMVRPAAARRD